MAPDIGLRIQSILRSIREVIIPALPQTERLAADQAQLIIGNLLIIIDQHELIFHYALTELAEFSGLLRDLSHEIGDDSGEDDNGQNDMLLARAQSLLELHLPAYREIDDLVRATRGATDRLIRATAEHNDSVVQRRLAKLLMDQSARQIERERAWTAASGFDPDRNSIPPLAHLLRA